MRSLLLTTTALALPAAALLAPAPARAAHGDLVMRLSAQLSEVERLNDSRPCDDVQRAIAHQVRMINDRFTELAHRSQPLLPTLERIDESLLAIQQYNQNARFGAPFVSHRIDRTVAQMRAEVAEVRHAGLGPDRGWGRDRWDRGRWDRHPGRPGWGHGAYPGRTTYPGYGAYVPPPPPYGPY